MQSITSSPTTPPFRRGNDCGSRYCHSPRDHRPHTAGLPQWTLSDLAKKMPSGTPAVRDHEHRSRRASWGPRSATLLRQGARPGPNGHDECSNSGCEAQAHSADACNVHGGLPERSGGDETYRKPAQP